MKKKVQFWSFSLPFLTLLVTLQVFASEEFVLREGSRLRFEGDSTAHPYSVEAKEMKATMVWDASKGSGVADRKLLGDRHLKSLELTIPVQSLKSGKKGLDKKMYESMNAEQHPSIIFRLRSYRVAEELGQPEGFIVHATGILSVSGKENPIEIQAKVKKESEGFLLSGSKELLMSEFGIPPPTAMLGMLKTKDQITVRFEWVLGPQQGRKP